MTRPSDIESPESGETYFRREDWVSFGLASALVFIGYWFSLASNVGTGFSGIYSTGANYMGVPHPPGYPLWTIYGWLFTKLLPFSNIAWRLAISSAVAGALTCGLIALMVCRSSATLLAGSNGLQKLPLRDERILRMAAGVTAGVTFGFDGAFWRKAVIVDVWPLSMLLFATTLCLLMLWAQQPQRRMVFIAACFTFGLTLTNSQALIPAGLGLLFFTAFVDKNTGRDAALVASILLGLWRLGDKFGLLPGNGLAACETKLIFDAITLLTVALYVMLTIRTHRWLPNWRIVLATLSFFAGLGLYVLIPVFSMSNPPVNWGYPRTVEGFAHVLSRGQYEKVQPVKEVCTYPRQIWQFGVSTLKDFGVIPTTLALVSLIPLLRTQLPGRQQIFGMLAIFASMTLLLIALMNPPPDRQATELVASYYTPSHLVLAVLLGHGLVLLGTFLSRSRQVDSGLSARG